MLSYFQDMGSNIPDFTYEEKLWQKGHKHVAGLDEVGRGSFAGPVVAGCVAFDRTLQGASFKGGRKIIIDDSKKLTEKQREISAEWIKENVLCWSVGEASVEEINRHGMAKATKKAFRRAVSSANKKVETRIDFLLIDAFYIPYTRDFPIGRKGSKNGRQKAVKKGDRRSFSIAAASIIAKVYRDNLMVKYARKGEFKKYKWHSNKGYGTKEHREALIKHGPSKLHRKQFVETFFEKRC